MSTTTRVQVRRVYDAIRDDDGTRVLVDRIWPRGMTKAKAALDEWCKDVSPSTELRKWYGHDPAKFDEFAKRYKAELKDPARAQALASHVASLASHRPEFTCCSTLFCSPATPTPCLRARSRQAWELNWAGPR